VWVVWHDRVTWCIYKCAFICVTCLVYTCIVCLTWLHCVIWLIYTCDVTDLYMYHDSFICVTWSCKCATWLTHTCDLIHLLTHPTHRYCNMTMHMWDTTHSFLRQTHLHDSSTWITLNCGRFVDTTHWHVSIMILADSLTRLIDMTHMNRYFTHQCVLPGRGITLHRRPRWH